MAQSCSKYTGIPIIKQGTDSEVVLKNSDDPHLLLAWVNAEERDDAGAVAHEAAEPLRVEGRLGRRCRDRQCGGCRGTSRSPPSSRIPARATLLCTAPPVAVPPSVSPRGFGPSRASRRRSLPLPSARSAGGPPARGLPAPDPSPALSHAASRVPPVPARGRQNQLPWRRSPEMVRLKPARRDSAAIAAYTPRTSRRHGPRARN